MRLMPVVKAPPAFAILVFLRPAITLNRRGGTVNRGGRLRRGAATQCSPLPTDRIVSTVLGKTPVI
jgi:hypothetical protein